VRIRIDLHVHNDESVSVNDGIKAILKQGAHILANLQEMNDKLDAIGAGVSAAASGVNTLEDAIKALKAEVAAGHVVTQPELDALFDKAAAIGTALDSVNADIADPSDTEPGA
jgi:hypothetical protein